MEVAPRTGAGEAQGVRGIEVLHDRLISCWANIDLVVGPSGVFVTDAKVHGQA
jgi:hypothetical protein